MRGGGTHVINMRKRAETRRQRFERKRAAWLVDHPHPYMGWADEIDRLRGDCSTGAVSTPPTWSKGSKGKGRPAMPPTAITTTDLACILWAVECVGKSGLSLGQIDKCFRESMGVGCHRAKAIAGLRWLESNHLICITGNYSKGRHGNKYRRLLEGEQPPMRPKPLPRSVEPKQLKPIDPLDNPWV